MKGETMKTYKTYGACEHYTSSQPYPVHHGKATLWASGAALRTMRSVGSGLEFAPGQQLDNFDFDRVWTLVTDGRDWGVRLQLSRGYPSPWPHIELFSNRREAIDSMTATAMRYEEDPRWTRRPCKARPGPIRAT